MMFAIYKKGQGYWTRMLTVVGGSGIVLLGAYWLYQHPLANVAAWLFPREFGYGQMVRAFGAALFIIAAGYLVFYASYLHQRAGDFLIATEGEMKKVSWSSRKEIVGSTQVVIFTLLALGVVLFVVDLFFMLTFSWAGVLRITGLKELLFGTGGT